MKRRETPVCGMAAVKALFDADPQAVLRLFFVPPQGRRLGAMCAWLAREKRVYRQVEPAELEKISGTKHHGGVVAVIEAPVLRHVRPEDVRAWAAAGGPLLVLERIGNAHNLGAIVRTAAFFGFSRIILPDDARSAGPGEAAYRVAEGGMQHVQIYRVKDLPAFLRSLRPHYRVLGTAVRGAQPPGALPADRRPAALVLGNEEEGLSAGVLAACEARVTIPGSGKVESLNVSAAAAILMWEFGAGQAGG